MSRSARSLSVPAELMFLMEQPGLLPGENRRDFEALRLVMIEEIRPETKIEWLWLLDLVERSWEILRYALRHGLAIASRTIPAFQQDVIELARALSPAGDDFDDAALIAAEAEIDLLRIRKYRAALIEET